jgi:hypothetical protein
MAAEGTRMTIDTPPRWAEWLLQSIIAREHRHNVSGDLLEEYRQVVLPARGRRRADGWYLAQVAGYVLRHAVVWAAVFAGAYLWRQPYARAALAGRWVRPCPASTDWCGRPGS